MPLTTLESDLNFIQHLDNYPPDDEGMTPALLKSRFDAAGNAIKTFLNDTMIPELDSAIDSIQIDAAAAQQAVSDATGYASAASDSAAAAAGSASAASTSAANAAASASNASTKATEASSSAAGASSAKTAAESARDSAVTAKTAAETAESNAEDAQTAAQTAATNAGNSATAAAASETSAAGSADTATTKAGEASASASSASASASTATTKAGEATASASAAAASASDASDSADAAVASESNAASSAVAAAASAQEAAAIVGGDFLTTSGDGSSVTAAFTEVGTRANIATGETLAAMFGKIKKWYSDFGSAAWAAASSFASAVHTHTKSQITDFPSSMPPTAHKNSHATGGTDALSASDVGAIPTSQKGSASGVAELDTGGKVPSAQLPSYVDDVLEYANLASFPASGESGKIYVAQDTNITYRWSGSSYIEISQSIALGETSATAYRGDRGKTAYDHSQTSGNPHGLTAGQLNAVTNIVVLANGADLNTLVTSGFYRVDGTPVNGPSDVNAAWCEIIVCASNDTVAQTIYTLSGVAEIRIGSSGPSSWTAWSKLWTNNNDGSGSGLDADMLDSKHYTDFPQRGILTTLAEVNTVSMLTGLYSVRGVQVISGGASYSLLIHAVDAGDSTSAIQTLISGQFSQPLMVYTRKCVGANTWGDWSRLFTTANPPTAAEVGAIYGLTFTNTSVLTSAFVSDTTYSNWGRRATVPLTGVTADMIPEVVFDPDTVTGGVLAPIASCYDGGVYLYAKSVPGANLTIPTIRCTRG